MSQRTIRCFSRTLVLIVAVLVLGAGAALAQTHPVGVNIQKICPFFVNQGETYQCTFSLQNNDTSHGIINLHVFESHPPVVCAVNQMTPCTGEVEVACVGGPTANSLATNGTAGDTCTGTLPDFTAPITCSTDPAGFQDTDRIRSTGNDAGIPALAATGSADNGPVVRALICPADTNECTSDICTPGIGCEHPNLPDSDPCTDSDANACTTAGCEAGVCVQAHNETVCTPDTNECTSDPACDPATGLCEHPNLPDSDPCTDSDANACTTAGCEAGVCVQAHNTTVCTPDTNECTSDPACDPATGLCEHPAVPDSDPCTDSDQNACTTPGCEAGACVQAHQETVCTPDTNECTSDPACDPATGLCEHPNLPDSDPCTDSDANACTTPGCEAGACVQVHQETTCTPDTNECTSDPACDPATGLCEHPAVPDSDPCTDSDANACTTAGCEAGACVQAHNETVCTPDTNECTSDPACDPATGACDHPPVGDSTPCTDSGDVCFNAGCEAGVCVQTHLESGDPSCNPTGGRMTGGGSVFTVGGVRVTHGFELHCNINDLPNNLEINWAKGNNFHLDELTSATCTDEPGLDPPPPDAGFDTYIGTGTGTCNGVPGATIEFTLTDAGEPGGGKDAPNDTATFLITCSDGLTLTVSGDIKKGNQQAHKN